MVSKLREDLKSELESYGDIKKILIHVKIRRLFFIM